MRGGPGAFILKRLYRKCNLSSSVDFGETRKQSEFRVRRRSSVSPPVNRLLFSVPVELSKWRLLHSTVSAAWSHKTLQTGTGQELVRNQYQSVRVAAAASWCRSRLMESDCRIPVACCRPRVLVLHALFWGLVSLRVFGAALLSEEKTSAVRPVVAPCWLLEEFIVTTECSLCNAFQTRSWSSCGLTGYVERVNCTRSNRDEYKSCRSAVMEEHLFWKFEAAMLALTAVFAVLVVVRQRWLDRLASEKVRRQIESI